MFRVYGGGRGEEVNERSAKKAEKKKKKEETNTKVSEPLLSGAGAGKVGRAIARERDGRIVRQRCAGPVQ